MRVNSRSTYLMVVQSVANSTTAHTQTIFPNTKKVANPNKTKQVKLSVLLDKLTELGWDYTCGRMSRSGMQYYDEIMQYVGVLDANEHWNEDVYSESNGDW